MLTILFTTLVHAGNLFFATNWSPMAAITRSMYLLLLHNVQIYATSTKEKMGVFLFLLVGTFTGPTPNMWCVLSKPINSVGREMLTTHTHKSLSGRLLIAGDG